MTAWLFAYAPQTIRDGIMPKLCQIRRIVRLNV